LRIACHAWCNTNLILASILEDLRFLTPRLGNEFSFVPITNLQIFWIWIYLRICQYFFNEFAWEFSILIWIHLKLVHLKWLSSFSRRRPLGCWPRRSKPSSSTVSSLSSLLSEKQKKMFFGSKEKLIVSSLSSLLSKKQKKKCLCFEVYFSLKEKLESDVVIVVIVDVVWKTKQKKGCFRHRPQFSFVFLSWKKFCCFYCLQFCIMLF
jgi:hypothetical protein